MSADFLVQEGRIWHEYQRVVVNEGAREWNTQRVNRKRWSATLLPALIWK
jgi:hypothetical protein